MVLDKWNLCSVQQKQSHNLSLVMALQPMASVITTDKTISIKVELTIINYKLHEEILHQERKSSHTTNGRSGTQRIWKKKKKKMTNLGESTKSMCLKWQNSGWIEQQVFHSRKGIGELKIMQNTNYKENTFVWKRLWYGDRMRNPIYIYSEGDNRKKCGRGNIGRFNSWKCSKLRKHMNIWWRIPNSKQHKEKKITSRHLLVKLQTAKDKKETLKTTRT